MIIGTTNTGKTKILLPYMHSVHSNHTEIVQWISIHFYIGLITSFQGMIILVEVEVVRYARILEARN